MIRGTCDKRRRREIAHRRDELALLMKPAPKMPEKERRQVKKVARDLLDLLKGEKLVLDWRKKEMTRAGVWQTIEIMLDYLPEVFDKPLYEKKCDAVYQHVYDAYYGQDRSVYGTVH